LRKTSKLSNRGCESATFRSADKGNDGRIDQWTDWTEIKGSYDYIEGFSKQVARTPAQLDLAKLPAGFGFQVELRLTDTTENKSKPIIERMTLSFAD
jgi:hypothetical protein